MRLLAVILVLLAAWTGCRAVGSVVGAITPYGREGSDLQCVRSAGRADYRGPIAYESLQASGRWTAWPLGLDCAYRAPGAPVFHQAFPDWSDTRSAVAYGATALGASALLIGIAVRRRPRR